MKPQTSSRLLHRRPSRSVLGKVSTAVGTAACVVWLVATSGCGKPNESHQPLRPSDVRSFDTLFATHCSGCHGAEGKLGPAPPLNDRLFLAMTGEDQLREIIANGRAGYLMPPFARAAGGLLVDEQVAVLVEGIRSRWGEPELRATLPDWVLANGKGGPTTGSGDAAAGRETYTALCTKCHGDATAGDASAPNSPEFLALMSDQTLRRLLVTGRSDLGMPDYEGMKKHWKKSAPLGQQDVADVLAYLAQCRNRRAENRDAITRSDTP